MNNEKPLTVAERRAKFGKKFTKPGVTQQHFKDESNINKIMAKYEKTGIVEHLNKHQGQYGDFYDIPQYNEALNQIMLAQNMFDALPARIRKKFDNDPVLFVDFAQNPENQQAMHELGLAPAPEASPEPSQPKKEAPPPDKPET